MAEIKDIEKLRPELLSVPDAEFERLKAEMQMADERRKQIKEEKERQAKLDMAQQKYDALMDSLRWMETNKFLPEFLKEALTDATGNFAPHRKLKRPKT